MIDGVRYERDRETERETERVLPSADSLSKYPQWPRSGLGSKQEVGNTIQVSLISGRYALTTSQGLHEQEVRVRRQCGKESLSSYGRHRYLNW